MSLSLAPVFNGKFKLRQNILFPFSLVGENVLTFSLICDVNSVSVANSSKLILWLWTGLKTIQSPDRPFERTLSNRIYLNKSESFWQNLRLTAAGHALLHRASGHRCMRNQWDDCEQSRSPSKQKIETSPQRLQLLSVVDLTWKDSER